MVSFIAHSWNADWSAPALMNRLSTGIWPALATISTRLDTGRHANGISVVLTAGTLLTEVYCKDGGQMYRLARFHFKVWAQKLVRNNRRYIISKYVLTDTFCTEKWRDREVYAIMDDTL